VPAKTSTLTDTELIDAENRARAWLVDNNGNVVAVRSRALNEELLALDALAMAAELHRLRSQQLTREDKTVLEFAMRVVRVYELQVTDDFGQHGDDLRDCAEALALLSRLANR